jgi:hypothetical protein
VKTQDQEGMIHAEEWRLSYLSKVT